MIIVHLKMKHRYQIYEIVNILLSLHSWSINSTYVARYDKTDHLPKKLVTITNT